MRKRKFIAFIAAAMTMAAAPVQAQVKLVVTPNNGGETGEYALQDISKITFGADGMHIVGTSLVPEPVWNLAEIKTITFADVVTGIGQVRGDAAGKVGISLRGGMIYVSGLGDGMDADAAIFDISGKAALRTKCAEGRPIDIAMLRQGVYIIKVNNATFKFVKQ